MTDRPTIFPADVLARALDARDPRFDGLFFVGITTTMVYCRPTCPARVSYPERRRFFDSAAAAEHAGFRPCLRCRPELAPGRGLIDAVPRLASLAAHRIAAGALNDQRVVDLARELGVSERHLRRVMERELGVSPVELAQTLRLLLAKRLLTDTSLSVTRIAFASGFQSLRRFNAVFRARYGRSPTTVRRAQPSSEPPSGILARTRATRWAASELDLVRLTLAYRPPFAWQTLTTLLRREAMPGVQHVDGNRYGRTVRVDGKHGVVFVEDAAALTSNGRRPASTHVNVDVSPGLAPVLMPLLARLRQLFDLDAEPSVVHQWLERGGLSALVRQRPGLRVPGAFDGFEVALRALLGESHRWSTSRTRSLELLRRVAHHLGDAVETGYPMLTRLSPSPERVAEAGIARLVALGVPAGRARAIVTLARAVVSGALRLEPGSDVIATRQALLTFAGVGDTLATMIVMRALHWPDAFPASDRALQRATGIFSSRALRARAEQWRPWRAYAALHLWLEREEFGCRTEAVRSLASNGQAFDATPSPRPSRASWRGQKMV